MKKILTLTCILGILATTNLNAAYYSPPINDSSSGSGYSYSFKYGTFSIGGRWVQTNYSTSASKKSVQAKACHVAKDGNGEARAEVGFVNDCGKWTTSSQTVR